jgi:hypothetical protein
LRSLAEILTGGFVRGLELQPSFNCDPARESLRRESEEKGKKRRGR